MPRQNPKNIITERFISTHPSFTSKALQDLIENPSNYGALEGYKVRPGRNYLRIDIKEICQERGNKLDIKHIQISLQYYEGMPKGELVRIRGEIDNYLRRRLHE